MRSGTAQRRIGPRQGGMVLIASLLLLIVLTIFALSMFRSFGIQEKIAGNVREKQRALQGAESAQQYAEWWLTSGNNAVSGSTVCSNLLNANLGQGQICSNVLSTSLISAGSSVASLPWQLNGSVVGVIYTPPNMNVTAAASANNGAETYYAAPGFYISDLGTAADGQGEAYEIDAYGYGASATAVAVVKSTYELSSGVVNRGGP